MDLHTIEALDADPTEFTDDIFTYPTKAHTVTAGSICRDCC